jgi:hypothetical protein
MLRLWGPEVELIRYVAYPRTNSSVPITSSVIPFRART